MCKTSTKPVWSRLLSSNSVTHITIQISCHLLAFDKFKYILHSIFFLRFDFFCQLLTVWHTSRYRLVVTRWPLTLTLACANCCRDHCLVQNRSASYLNLIKPVCCSKCCPSDLNSTFFIDISKGFAEIAQSLKLPSLQNQGLQVLPSDKYPLLSISAVAGISS